MFYDIESGTWGVLINKGLFVTAAPSGFKIGYGYMNDIRNTLLGAKINNDSQPFSLAVFSTKFNYTSLVGLMEPDEWHDEDRVCFIVEHDFSSARCMNIVPYKDQPARLVHEGGDIIKDSTDVGKPGFTPEGQFLGIVAHVYDEDTKPYFLFVYVHSGLPIFKPNGLLIITPHELHHYPSTRLTRSAATLNRSLSVPRLTLVDLCLACYRHFYSQYYWCTAQKDTFQLRRLLASCRPYY